MSGLGRIYKRKDVWWIDYSFRGKRRRESSGSTRRGDATKLLRKRTAEMGKGRLVGPDQERLTFEDLGEIIVSEYEAQERKSLNRLHVSLRALGEFFGTSPRPGHHHGPCGRLHRLQAEDGPSQQHDPQRGERPPALDGPGEEGGQAG